MLPMSLPRRLLSLAIVAAAALLPAGLFALERGPVRTTPTSATAASSAASNSARVIVRLREGASMLGSQATVASANAATASTGPRLAATLGQRAGLTLSNGRALDARTQVVKATGLDSATLAQQLAADAEVEWAVVDQRRRAYAAPNDPLYAASATGSPASGQWYLRAPSGEVKSSINVETAWAVTLGSSSIVVAVLDTGIRASHPDLVGKVLAGYDFVADVPTANDGNGRDSDPTDPGDWVSTADTQTSDFADCTVENSSWHGTQVAGLIGAATNNGVGMAGIARNVKVLPVRVLGKCGGYDSDIIAGMRWAAGLAVSGVSTNPNPARVINMSLGSSGSCTAAYQSAVTELAAKNVLVVAAAGNDGLAVGVPANCSGAIGVGGVRHTGTKVGYANLGPEVTISAPAGNCVNDTGECLYPILSTSNTGITTPGVAKYTTGGADAALGTSFSTPIVSGTVALMLSAQSGLSNAQVITALKAHARPFPTTGADSGVLACQAPSGVAQDTECYCTTSTCGAGLLDAGAVVAASSGLVTVVPAISATPASPVVGTAIGLDGSASTVGTGRTIASYLWEITAGASLASFSSATNAATATLDTTGAGTVTVRLTVTDSQGQHASVSKTLTISAASGGSSSGGGAWSPLWALGLLVLSLALPARRRR